VADDTLKLDVKGLDQLLKALKANPPNARVGILGSTNPRSGKSPSNATVGAAHEFGTSKMPQRSFLRIPIADNLANQMQASGAFDKDVLKAVIKSGTVLPWIKKVTMIAEQIVLEAFATSGYGKWAPWKKGYTSKTGQILVDTNQLRDSITSEVKP